MSRARAPMALVALMAMVLAGCSQEPAAPAPQETEIPQELVEKAPPAAVAKDGNEGTPLAQREATLGLLNKRNNISQDIKLKPGESQRIGNVIIRLQSCERSPQWENPPQTGAFVQVLVEERQSVDEDLEWKTAFSGWLFKESPSLNVVEHPVYDVWVKECAMSFPGEISNATASADSAAKPSGN